MITVKAKIVGNFVLRFSLFVIKGLSCTTDILFEIFFPLYLHNFCVIWVKSSTLICEIDLTFELQNHIGFENGFSLMNLLCSVCERKQTQLLGEEEAFNLDCFFRGICGLPLCNHLVSHGTSLKEQ